MADILGDEPANLWLGALPEADRKLLAPHLSRVHLARELVLVPTGRPIEHIYFPEGGIVSVVLDMMNAGTTEIGIFGREGMSSIAGILSAEAPASRTFVQIEGATALRMDMEAFRDAMDRSASLRTSTMCYIQTFLTQVSYSVVSNARYALEARLVRWLLMCHDRIDGDELALTHDLMAVMIGAQRTGVTVTLHVLEGAGLIKSKRGRVIILSRERLEEVAGSAYGVPETEYRKLIGKFGRSRSSAPPPAPPPANRMAASMPAGAAL